VFARVGRGLVVSPPGTRLSTPDGDGGMCTWRKGRLAAELRAVDLYVLGRRLKSFIILERHWRFSKLGVRVLGSCEKLAIVTTFLFSCWRLLASYCYLPLQLPTYAIFLKYKHTTHALDFFARRAVPCKSRSAVALFAHCAGPGASIFGIWIARCPWGPSVPMIMPQTNQMLEPLPTKSELAV